MRLNPFKAVAVVFVISALNGRGQELADPATALLQVRERLLPELARMPHYTCVQTITRKYFRAPSHHHDKDCHTIIAASQVRRRELPLQGWDRLRLEIAIVQGGNVFSWLGASRFEDSDIEAFAGRGPLGSGDFGPFLDSILDRGVISFRRESAVGGRHLLEYSYDMPLERSRYNVQTDQGWVVTPFHGEIVLDPQAPDIVSLTVRTAELPESGRACQATSEVEYGRTKIHDRLILIPRETRLRTLHDDSSETLNSTSYTACREYASNSRMLMQAPPEPAGSSAPGAPQAPRGPLPAGLRFSGRIVTTIDSDTAAAGDPIEGVLRSAIRDKTNQVIAPAGSRFRGRLMRVERRLEPGEYVTIGLRFESVQAGGYEIPLAALSYSMRPRNRFEGVFPAIRVPADNPAGITTFLFAGSHVYLKHLDGEWITVSEGADGDPKK